MSSIVSPLPLAPLQRVMLKDSLAFPNAGHHVEQVKIRFSQDTKPKQVISAWKGTVAATKALQMAFLTDEGEAVGWKCVSSALQSEPRLSSWNSQGTCLEAERSQNLLVVDQVPWRVAYQPEERYFIWTFHHALLDGRSITRVLRNFIQRLNGKDAEDLLLSKWHKPSSATLASAEQIFREMAWIPKPATAVSPAESNGSAIRCLGENFALCLESHAAAIGVTAATILTWAWGQALAEASGTAAVLVEQLRAGVPQPGTAGFTMNTLPIVIHRRDSGGEVALNLLQLYSQLRALREIETVSADDFSLGVFPNMDLPGGSVIMIEHATLQHMVGGGRIESVVLHEAKGETLMATAYLLPDLRLEVEGPGRHRLLESWIGILKRGVHLA